MANESTDCDVIREEPSRLCTSTCRQDRCIDSAGYTWIMPTSNWCKLITVRVCSRETVNSGIGSITKRSQQSVWKWSHFLWARVFHTSTYEHEPRGSRVSPVSTIRMHVIGRIVFILFTNTPEPIASGFVHRCSACDDVGFPATGDIRNQLSVKLMQRFIENMIHCHYNFKHERKMRRCHIVGIFLRPFFGFQLNPSASNCRLLASDASPRR